MIDLWAFALLIYVFVGGVLFGVLTPMLLERLPIAPWPRKVSLAIGSMITVCIWPIVFVWIWRNWEEL